MVEDKDEARSMCRVSSEMNMKLLRREVSDLIPVVILSVEYMQP